MKHIFTPRFILEPIIQDNNLAFWENLIKESESKIEPANYVDGLFCCAMQFC